MTHSAIPYVTSYYKRRWGFCLTEEARGRLEPGLYHARIDSSFDENGEVGFGQCVLKGETPGEILLSSYLCHPSMANNELSGPLVLAALYRRIASWPRRRYTYRFVLNPETIGSLCYLHRYADHLTDHLVAGMVLTCVGGPSHAFSYKTSRAGNSLLDRLADHLASRPHGGSEDIGRPVALRPFTPTSGSDERQYCSPGFNFPVGQMARTVYGEYPGYHNSLDDKEFMGIESLLESVDALERFLKLAELAGPFRNLCPCGEPQLSRRNLYPTENSAFTWNRSSDALVDQRTLLNEILMVLNYADTRNDMIDIAGKCGIGLSELTPVIEILEREGLLALVDPTRGDTRPAATRPSRCHP